MDCGWTYAKNKKKVWRDINVHLSVTPVEPFPKHRWCGREAAQPFGTTNRSTLEYCVTAAQW